MALSPFASGLLNVVSGQGKAAEGRMADAAKEDQIRREIEIKDEYLQRVEERKRQQNIGDIKAIGDTAESRLASGSMAGIGSVGAGAELSVEDVQTLRDNPAALKSYRESGATGLLNYTRQQEAESRADAALSIGRTDLADKYEAAARGERQDAKEDARHKDAMKKLDQQIAQAGAAAARADTHNADANDRARLSALSTSIREDRLMLTAINTQLTTETDPAKIIELKSNAQDLTDRINENTQLSINFGKTGKFDPPKNKGTGKDFSDLFDPQPAQPSNGGGNNSDEQKDSSTLTPGDEIAAGGATKAANKTTPTPRPPVKTPYDETYKDLDNWAASTAKTYGRAISAADEAVFGAWRKAVADGLMAERDYRMRVRAKLGIKERT